MIKSYKEITVVYFPKCDLCSIEDKDNNAVYDGKTIFGSWANMCEEHFRTCDIGLGLGKGQKLVETKEEH